jgi:hypothetical protein
MICPMPDLPIIQKAYDLVKWFVPILRPGMNSRANWLKPVETGWWLSFGCSEPRVFPVWFAYLNLKHITQE